MRIGFSLLNNWGIEDAQALVGLASRAEELGFDSVWVPTTCSTWGTCSTGSAASPTTSR